jgi:IclR family KDG regulon transcriptional repressor
MLQNKTQGAASIRKCLAILDAFTLAAPRLTLSEISKTIKAPMPTVSRIVAVLCEEGFLEKNNDRTYQPGWKCCRLGAVFDAGTPIKTLALPRMKKLRDICNETVSLYLRRGLERICYEQVQSAHALKRISVPGEMYPLWAGGTGKCFLAYMPPEEVESVKKSAPDAFQKRWDIIMEQVRLVRKCGYSYSIAEREAGISSVAAPVFDFTGQPVACLTISGPSIRFTDELVSKIITSILSEARELSLSLGAENEMVSFPKPVNFPHLQS